MLITVSLWHMAKSSTSNFFPELAVVVCTKDRPAHLSNLLTCLSRQSKLPRTIVVVDSSHGVDSQAVVSEWGRIAPAQLHYLKSEPGLPRQRNVGIDFLKRLWSWKSLKYVWFLDDDIEFGSGFLESGLKVMNGFSDCMLLGAFDLQGHSLFSKIGTSLVSLQRARGGKLLKSGLVVPPMPERTFEETDFVPGFSMLVRASALSHVKFDSEIRMYGEDIEFQLRLRRLGIVGCSKELGLAHNASPINRESARYISAFSDGFRWRLHRQHPDKVSGVMVLFSTIALLISDLVLALVGRDSIRLESARGHVDFVTRVMRGKPTEQRAS
jgi:GT2 family glycosyltransferase